MADNKEVEFPDKLCSAIAEITDKFSFAYMQEAFVAALLAIARGRDDSIALQGMKALTLDMADDGWVEVLRRAHDDKDLEKFVLWVEIKKQIEILREGMDDETGSSSRGLGVEDLQV